MPRIDAGGCLRAGEAERQQAGAGTDIEHAVARADLHETGEALGRLARESPAVAVERLGDAVVAGGVELLPSFGIGGRLRHGALAIRHERSQFRSAALMVIHSRRLTAIRYATRSEMPLVESSGMPRNRAPAPMIAATLATPRTSAAEPIREWKRAASRERRADGVDHRGDGQRDGSASQSVRVDERTKGQRRAGVGDAVEQRIEADVVEADEQLQVDVHEMVQALPHHEQEEDARGAGELLREEHGEREAREERDGDAAEQEEERDLGREVVRHTELGRRPASAG